ncbi:DUF3558 domain-containing protein [Nocardia sp. NPDC005366]|uniref:DUF3558 domain-containing protein n=1 Tax=Nocardia sp. NPDC005366 TaxID=3156878 RepID=UPI0033AAD4F1
MAYRWKLLLVTAAMAPGLTSCGISTSENPTTTTSAAPATLFDPCTGIPDDVLKTAGVDPSRKESGIAGVRQSGWEICSWRGPKYTIGVFSTGRTVSEFENKAGNVEFEDVVVAGRKGRQFRVEGGSYDLMCDILLPVMQGVVQIKLSNNPILDNPAPPCLLVRQASESIVPVLPK